ncbi:MAG: hypothetical protein J5648_03825 [Lachnospiraceae bacterium]|nr:hypothetical protein [Lachnospiraceae bacterium]MBR5666778.1 hypothetical protein [Lachnospiraceae bacterium]
MDCRSCKKCTELYIDGQLPQNRIVAYTDHLASCPECTEDLHINYAILTALRQLNEGQDLSDNFATEVDNKLKVARFKIRREARLKVYRRVFIFFEIVGLALAFSIFTPKEKTYAFLPDDAESKVVISFYGIPGYMDPVLKGIYKYNDEVLAAIKEMEKETNNR